MKEISHRERERERERVDLDVFIAQNPLDGLIELLLLNSIRIELTAETALSDSSSVIVLIGKQGHD